MQKRIVAAAVLAGISLPARALELGGIGLSGVVGVETRLTADSRPVDVSSYYLGLDSTFSERVSGHIAFLHEDYAPSDVTVDEATLRVRLGDATTAAAGRMYVPFGLYETSLVTGALTAELGETRAPAILLDTTRGPLNVGGYVFTGSGKDTGGDDYGLGLYLSGGGTLASGYYTVRTSLISDLAYSNVVAAEASALGLRAGAIPGASIAASWEYQSWRFYVEHVRALSEFVYGEFADDAESGPVEDDDFEDPGDFEDPADLEEDFAEAPWKRTPSTTHAEIGYRINDDWAAAASYSTSRDAEELGLLDVFVGAAATAQIAPRVLSTIEIGRGRYGNESDTAVKLQLTAVF